MTPLGIVSDEITKDFRESVRIATSLGIRRFEIRNLACGRAPMCGEAAMIEAEGIAREAGVEITALSPGLFKLTDTEQSFRREMSEVYPRAAEWAKRWNLPGLIVFGFHKPGATEPTAPQFPSDNPPAQVREWLTEAAERAEKDGLTLMIEPEPICWCDTGRATVATAARPPQRTHQLGSGNVAWLENCDPIGEFHIVAPYIANVHIKDIRPVKGDPEWVPAGEGIVGLRGTIPRLKSIVVSRSHIARAPQWISRPTQPGDARKLWRDCYESNAANGDRNPRNHRSGCGTGGASATFHQCLARLAGQGAAIPTRRRVLGCPVGRAAPFARSRPSLSPRARNRCRCKPGRWPTGRTAR
jgi:sugar phosphate isomerase/epimerase